MAQRGEGGRRDRDALSRAQQTAGPGGADKARHAMHRPARRTYLTPHIAGVTELSYTNMAKVVAREVARLWQGLPPSRQLNQPTAPRLLLQGQ